MAEDGLSLNDQLKNLDQARLLVLKDPVYWPQIFRGILPVVAIPTIELRRWGSRFLAETFSSPVLNPEVKQELAKESLDTLLILVMEKDVEVAKNIAQCCASVYPFIFKLICKDPKELVCWQKMAYIKSQLLGLWDSAIIGVRICCLKFAQRVIQVQTPGITDPRLADRSDVSLSLMPPNHPLGLLPSLEAEGQALLDRLLATLHEHSSNPLLVTATLNTLPVLIKTRHTISNKVLNAMLMFNPFALTANDATQQDLLMAKCIEKTTRVLLMHLLRTNPNGPNASKINQHLGRLNQARVAVNEETSRKRALFAAQGNEPAKRHKKIGDVTSTPTPPPPPPPPPPPAPKIPETLADVFTLTNDPALSSFDAQQLPLDIVLRITLLALLNVNQQALETALSDVKARLASIPAARPKPIEGKAEAPESEETVRTLATVRPASSQIVETKQPTESSLVPRIRTESPENEEQAMMLAVKLSPEDCFEGARASVDRLLEVGDSLERSSFSNRKKDQKLGMNRVAASNWDRESWVTMVSRLSTRGLGVSQSPVKLGDGTYKSSELSDYIREQIFNYVTVDWRQRLDVIVAWLNEEWYNDLMAKSEDGQKRQPQYPIWMSKVMHAIFPYLEAKDKTFLRILSEIPVLDADVFAQVKILCLDPDRVTLGFLILTYLIMYKPPSRELSLDVLTELYKEHPEVRTQCKRFLARFRPSVIAELEGIKTEAEGTPS